MNADSKRGTGNAKTIHWGRFIVAFFALLVAATHLGSAIPSGGGGAPPSGAAHYNQTSTSRPAGFAQASFGSQALGLWIDIEVIAYTIMAMVFLLGLRTWYPAVTVFNAFNVILYFLSGLMPIPGITSSAFMSHFTIGISLTSTVLVISWIAVLVLSLVLLKYDRGSELDRILVTHKNLD